MAAPYYTYGTNLLNREKYTSTISTEFPDIYGSNVRRYFSSIDTDVYFGDLLIDEMVAFDFMIEEKKVPIYGYNTFVPKRIIVGQKTIQGSFAINFTRTFNMQYILDNIEESLYANAYEEAQFYCSEDNAALFGKGFDITLSYGDDKGAQSYNSCSQTLVGCYITSYRQAFDTSGEPILDMYTFIAKDLIVQRFEAQEQVIDDDYNIESDNVSIKEDITGEGGWKIANLAIQGQDAEMENFCDKNKSTVGIYIHPQYVKRDGVSSLEMYVCPYNRTNLKLTDIKLTLTDTSALKKTSEEFELTSKDKYYYHKKLTGEYVSLGNTIGKLFSERQIKSLDCSINMKYIDGETEQSISLDTILDWGEIINY